MELSLLEALNAERAARRAAVLVTDLGSGAQRLVRPAGVAADPLADLLTEALRTGRSRRVEVEGRALFLDAHIPAPRLVITGAVRIARALVPMAGAVGFEMTIVESRADFAAPEGIPGVTLCALPPDEAASRVALDPFTAVAALTHDPGIDDPLLTAGLAAGCFYVGALGSRRTHAARVERLAERGVPREALARLHAPIGLDIGAVSPAEIAVSILADLVGALRRRPPRETGPMAGEARDIHGLAARADVDAGAALDGMKAEDA